MYICLYVCGIQYYKELTWLVCNATFQIACYTEAACYVYAVNVKYRGILIVFIDAFAKIINFNYKIHFCFFAINTVKGQTIGFLVCSELNITLLY